jgi:hypothetical protein
MSREAQVRFCERRGVRFPPPTLLVVCCHSRQDAEQVQARLAGWLEPRGLAFNDAKTRIVPLAEGFDFLGHADLCVMPTSPESSCSPAVNGSRLSA